MDGHWRVNGDFVFLESCNKDFMVGFNRMLIRTLGHSSRAMAGF